MVNAIHRVRKTNHIDQMYVDRWNIVLNRQVGLPINLELYRLVICITRQLHAVHQLLRAVLLEHR
ncbi:hypothetical protein D3C73_1356580 [compost metagenome]